MKKRTLAFLYNVRHYYPDPSDYKHQVEADFDDPECTQKQLQYLKQLAKRVIAIEANDKAYLTLYRYRHSIDLVVNLAEGIYGMDRELQMPAMLEMLRLPYVGCTPLVEGLMLDKAKAKDVLIAHQLATLPYQLFYRETDQLRDYLKFPLIVKPVAQGSSAGITNDSIVYNDDQLRTQVRQLVSVFNQPALVEPYLSGREFSVAMIGNPPKILPIIESDHSRLPKTYQPIDSIEVKWYFEEKNSVNNLICPAKISRSLSNKITQLCLSAWRVIGVRDWCRIDIRCDKKNQPFILELNSPPGVTPPEVSTTSYFPLAARAAGIDYLSLLKMIVETAWKRYYL